VSASDDRAVSKIILYLNGYQFASVKGSNLDTVFNSWFLRGTYTLTATAVDTSNNKASSSIKVTFNR
jgi:hypothetical protein